MSRRPRLVSSIFVPLTASSCLFRKRVGAGSKWMPMASWRSPPSSMRCMAHIGEILSVWSFQTNDAGLHSGRHSDRALGIISAIGTCIPGIGWGVAVVANVLDASISVGRGDMIGAGMAMFGVFGDMFGCLADAGKAVNALSDTAAKCPACLGCSKKHGGSFRHSVNWSDGRCYCHIRGRAFFQNRPRGLD